MASTSVFSVWRFPTDAGAQRAAHALARCERVALRDAAVLSWPADRARPLVWQAQELAGETGLAGAFWGMLLSLLFFLPLSRGPIDAWPAGPGDDLGWSQRNLIWLGFDTQFALAVRSQVTTGTSALFLLDANSDSSALRETLPSSAQEVTTIALTAEQIDGLHSGFDD